jgi:hypothetical protein
MLPSFSVLGNHLSAVTVSRVKTADLEGRRRHGVARWRLVAFLVEDKKHVFHVYRSLLIETGPLPVLEY